MLPAFAICLPNGATPQTALSNSKRLPEGLLGLRIAFLSSLTVCIFDCLFIHGSQALGLTSWRVSLWRNKGHILPAVSLLASRACEILDTQQIVRDCFYVRSRTAAR